ncbi:MAG: V-type ATP synthase subunit D [Gammaproteobacteria bacterium]|nr:V-type ATP synthase subunit D [Gammaproteobacteria bacterium]
MVDITPTRSAYLELQEERLGMEEGYRFLDEKRLVLVAETMQELGRYETAQQEFQHAYDQAIQALQRAVSRHGTNDLEIYPPITQAWGELQRHSRSVLGLPVQDVLLEEIPPVADEPAINASPEAEETRRLFAHLITLSATLAGMASNLQRLRDEYQRTSRRARALEDVLLPEIDQNLAQLDTALEEMDKEEIVRIHYAMRP